MEKIKVILDEFGNFAVVKGEARDGSITTATHPFGGPNVTHYTVTLAGHEVEGTWADDARQYTTVRLPSDHPLYAACQKIAKSQEKYRQVAAMAGKTPTGWTYSDWQNAKFDERQAYAALAAEVDADETAVKLLIGYDDLANSL